MKLTLAQAAATLPPLKGKPPVWQSLYRWATIGLKSKSGKTVILKTERVGKTLTTTEQWLADFHAAIDDASAKEMPASVNVIQRQRAKRAKTAFDFLKAEGVI